MSARRVIGPVERAVRDLLKSRGELDPTRAVSAASAISTARLLDLETDGSKHAALTRELRQHLPALEVQPLRQAQPEEEKKPKRDNVSSLTDRVNAKRRKGAAS
jgi:hypothetical protein